ncbi:prolipoprotein diacylglyceryl transferase [Candidatus Bipolaricaulota bacterium]|nr:prolipoprotein diacylglyceryl transferase [Candidatus Bipolaricaulota bacterium]MBS3825394.1 prolipoprotein diacylglyceryl transferase [Candidatus Bipolaricaulota bacterium]
MNPIAFHIGPLSVRWYGIAYAVALVVSLRVLHLETDRKGLGLDLTDLIDFVLIGFPLGLLGARIYYALFYFDYFLDHPLLLFGIGEQGQFGLSGLAIHGGLIGGLIGLIIFVKLKRVGFWEFADALAPGLILGQAIGRVGNFLNGDAYGFPTDLPWGVVFGTNTAAGARFPDQKLHPTMLYELMLNLLIFLVLWRLRTREYRRGFIVSLYFILYSIGRSFVSFFRAGSLWIGPIRAAHLISILVVGGFGYYIWSRGLYRRRDYCSD